MREIWDMQIRLEDRPGKRVYSILSHPRFRASYDFLLLREQAGEPLGDLCQWWTEIQNVGDDKKDSIINALGNQPKKRRRKPKKKDSPPGDK
jgi:poly(A) polymerase